MQNSNCKSKNIERKYLSLQKSQFLNVKNNLLELEKGLIELKDRELKDRLVKIKREIQELLSLYVYINQLLCLQIIWINFKKEMTKIRTIKNTWCDQLINYIPDPIRKNAVDFKDKIVSLFNRNTSKQTVYGRGKKISKLKTQNNLEKNRQCRKNN